MSLIKWKDQYSINIKEMDGQHKRWVGFLNDLWEAKQAGKEFEEVNKILDGVIEYTKTHFTKEEKLMKQHDYPDLVLHKAEHNLLVEEVDNLCRKCHSGKNIVSELVQFLGSWLTGHITIVDKKYGEYLNNKGIT